MSYINDSNIYSSKKSNESQCNLYGRTPIEAVSYSTVSSNTDCNYSTQNQNSTYQTFNDNRPSQVQNQGIINNEVSPANCDISQPNISVTCNCNSNKEGCDFNCNAADNCCNCEVPNYNASQARPICTFLDYICDESKASGSTLFFDLDTASSSDKYNVLSQLVPLCCNSGTCTIDADTKFTIESSKVVLKNFKYTGTITPSDVLVNGNPVLAVQTTATGISATVDPSILDQDCIDCNKGTKVSILLNALSPWEFLAKYELCGKTNACGETCKFKVSIENLVTLPETLTETSTFVSPELCLPSNDPNRPIVINIDFKAIGQLINPVLTGSTVSPCFTLVAKLMISTSANLTSLQNTKVCFPAVLANSKKHC